MRFEVFNFYAAHALKFKDAAGADHGIERKVFETATVFHEMNRAIHVRAGVGRHG
jgi:hypothetical protein